MSKPHIFKHNGAWLVREKVGKQKSLCGGCIGEGDDRTCVLLPECSFGSPSIRINYIFKEFQFKESQRNTK